MTTNRSLAGVALRVRDPERLAAFYTSTLGMNRLDPVGGEEGGTSVGYGGRGAALVLRPSGSGPAYQHQPNDRYWKIAITVPNLEMAHAQLSKHGVTATAPHQFRDIAYMSHLADPEGHVIELIQHTFEGKPRTAPGNVAEPLGGGAQIGLVTLRTDDIESDLACCRDELGMAYLSRQEVSDRGFVLYFVALTDEMPPHADVDSVENREWLWQRPYTTLEFQHRLSGEPLRRIEGDVEGAVTVLIDTGGENPVVFR